MQANAVQCTSCKKLIHKRCNVVRGDLPRVADGFRCRQCNGTIQEANLAEDLMVDGELYGCNELGNLRKEPARWRSLLNSAIGKRVRLLTSSERLGVQSSLQAKS